MRTLGRTMRAAVLALSVTLAAAPAIAQQGRAPEPRAALEQRVRERIALMVQQRLELTDAEMRRLQGVNQKYERQRHELVRQEREARVALRREVASGDGADQKLVSETLDRLLALQRRRLDLLAEEQKELAGFLTPVQRAKYLALQDQLRSRVDELRRRQGPMRPRGGRPGGPGGAPGLP